MVLWFQKTIKWLGALFAKKVTYVVLAAIVVVSLGLGLGLGLGLQKNGRQEQQHQEQPQKQPAFTPEQMEFFASLKKPEAKQVSPVEISLPENLLADNEELSEIWLADEDYFVGVVKKQFDGYSTSRVEFFKNTANGLLKIEGGAVLEGSALNFQKAV